MTPPLQKATPPPGPKKKTSITMPDDVLQGLRHAAVEERTDVSALLTRLAEHFLKTRQRGR